MKSKEFLENIKDKIISEIFTNDEVGLEEKINFCRELENFGEGWRSYIFAGKLEIKKEVEKNDSSLENYKGNIEKNFEIKGEDYLKAKSSKEIPQFSPEFLKKK